MLRATRPRILMASVLLVAGLAAGCSKEEAPAPQAAPEPAEEPAPAAPASATAVFASLDGTIKGNATFTGTDGGVEVHVSVEGAPPGTHGFHIHDVGDCSAEDFTSAGGHFNPAGVPHGGPEDAERHAGDLGNIEIDEMGSGHLGLTSNLITISDGDNAVVGRAVILHADADDLNSQPTGAAGARLACGVVEADG